jgi:hypothetical protein
LTTHVLPVSDSEAAGEDAPVEEDDAGGEDESVRDDVCAGESAVLLGLAEDWTGGSGDCGLL